jgi:malic enzyme
VSGNDALELFFIMHVTEAIFCLAQPRDEARRPEDQDQQRPDEALAATSSEAVKGLGRQGRYDSDG